MKIDKKIIKELTDYLNEFNLTEIEYTEKDTKIKVSKSNSSISNQSISATSTSSSSTSVGKVAAKTTSEIISGIQVTSPIIGTAYHSPEPGAKKFVEVGKKIKKGDTVMIVEAMKTMNHVPSTADGVVREICVEDGQPVEFGQTLVILD
jgi:acetyl-CoA carboxylase biotin carboxyl carrier protein